MIKQNTVQNLKFKYITKRFYEFKLTEPTTTTTKRTTTTTSQ